MPLPAVVTGERTKYPGEPAVDVSPLDVRDRVGREQAAKVEAASTLGRVAIIGGVVGIGGLLDQLVLELLAEVAGLG